MAAPIRLFVRHLTSSSFSYVHGASAMPMLSDTIGQILRTNTEKFPEKEVFVFREQKIRKSYQHFLNDCEKLASGLLSIGVSKGDRVGIWAPNVYQWVVTEFASAMAGMILVNINPAYQPQELEYCLRKSGVKALVASRSFKTQNYYHMLVHICPELPNSKPGTLHSHNVPELKHVILTESDWDEKLSGTWSFSEIMQAGDSSSNKQLNQIENQLQPDHPVNIQFTSGTTGSPKGATLSHHNILNNAYFTGRRIGYDEKSPIICCPPPFYHCFGCVIGVLANVLYSGTLVSPSPGFDPLAALQAVHDEKCTALYGTPTMFIDMLNHPKFKEFSVDSLTGGIMAGSPCPVEVCKQLIENMNMKDFTIAYGTTENSPVTFQSLRTDPPEARVTSIGRVHDHVEAKIVDENGLMVPLGEKGELCTRGYVVMLGYWQDKDKTDEVIGPDRWYKTGDLAVMDGSGRVRMAGRSKDMVIRGGENLYPIEIEQILYTHPDIEDVQIIGVPDDRLGEELCAWIRLKHGRNVTDNDIRQFCKEKMAHFKIPRYILFKELNDFPVTVTGKIQKFKMREMSAIELGFDKEPSHIGYSES